MRLVCLLKTITVILLVALFFPSVVKADLLSPPDELVSPLTLGLFLANLIINFVLFGIAYLIFVESEIKKIKKKPFLVTIFLITLTGFFADSIAFHYSGTENVYASYIISSLLIFVSNFLITKYYLKVDLKKAIILGIWMGMATNPYSYYFIATLLSPFFSLTNPCRGGMYSEAECAGYFSKGCMKVSFGNTTNEIFEDSTENVCCAPLAKEIGGYNECFPASGEISDCTIFCHYLMR